MSLGVLVLARLNSTRLPGKMMLPILGRPLITLLSERLFVSGFTGPYILATSTSPSDNPLVELGSQLGFQCFRGSEEDVVDRMYAAMKHFGLGFAVIIEGDELFVDSKVITALTRLASEKEYNVIKVKSGPIGSWITGVRFQSIEDINRTKGNTSTDGWADLFKDIPSQISLDYDPPLPCFDKKIRLTIDYPQDLHLASEIYQLIGKNGDVHSLHKVLNLLRERPDLIAINAELDEIYWKRLRAQQSKFKPNEIN